MVSNNALKVRPPPEGKEDPPGVHNLAEHPIAGSDLVRINQNITSWEREEALAYDKIYFYGPKARKIEAAKVIVADFIPDDFDSTLNKGPCIQ